MKQYVTIKRWHDLEDNNFKYNVGDVYPREGLEPSKSRLKALSSTKNRRKTPLIEEKVIQDKENADNHDSGANSELNSVKNLQNGEVDENGSGETDETTEGN